MTDLTNSDSNLPATTNSDSELSTEFSESLSYVKKELLDTLEYIDGQLDDIAEKTKGVTRFSRNIFEMKKLFVEQRLNLLKQLSSLAVDKKRNEKEGDKDLPNISEILGAK